MYFDIKYDIISGTEEKGKEDKVMFCRKCGQKLEGVEKFCPKCGAEVVQVQMPQGVTKEPGKTNLYIGIGVICVLAVVVLLGVKALFFTSDYEKPIKNFVKAVETQDVKLFVSVIPEEAIEAGLEQAGMDKELFMEMAEAEGLDYLDDYDGKIKIKYEIEDERKLDKSEIRDIESELFNTVEIKEGKEVEIYIELYVDGELEDASSGDMNVIKVGRKWYIDPTSL